MHKDEIHFFVNVNMGLFFRLMTLGQSNISQTVNGPTLLTSAGAIVLLICSTAFETPATDTIVKSTVGLKS